MFKCLPIAPILLKLVPIDMLFACAELDDLDTPIDEYGEIETGDFKGAKDRNVVLRSTPQMVRADTIRIALQS